MRPELNGVVIGELIAGLERAESIWRQFRIRPRAKVDTIRLRVDLARPARVHTLKDEIGQAIGAESVFVEAIGELLPGGNSTSWLVTVQDPTPERLKGIQTACAARWGVRWIKPMSLDVALDWALKGADKRRNAGRFDDWSWEIAEPLVRHLRDTLAGRDLDPGEQWRAQAGQSDAAETHYLGDFERRDVDGRLLVPEGLAYRLYYKTRDRGRDLPSSERSVRLEARIGPRALRDFGLRTLEDLICFNRFERFAKLFFKFASAGGEGLTARSALLANANLRGLIQQSSGTVPEHWNSARASYRWTPDVRLNKEVRLSLVHLSRRWSSASPCDA